MKRALLLAAALATLLGFALPARQAQAAVSVGFSVGTGRHGGFSLSFASRPDVVLIPSSRVYYAPGLAEDLYCVDDEWYYCNDGTWYVADSYDGPFMAIAFASVPYEIRSVPVRYRRHWGGYDTYRAPEYSYRAPAYSYRTPEYRTTYRSYDSRTTYDRNRTWNREDQNRTWNREGSDRTWNRDDQDRGHGRGNGRGHGHGNGNGRGRWGR